MISITRPVSCALLLHAGSIKPSAADLRYISDRYDENLAYADSTDSRTDRRELYGIEADPGERVNLGSRLPMRTRYMHQQLQAWIASTPEETRGAAAPKVVATPEETEALAGLGYVDPNEGSGRSTSEKAPG